VAISNPKIRTATGSRPYPGNHCQQDLTGSGQIDLKGAEMLKVAWPLMTCSIIAQLTEMYLGPHEGSQPLALPSFP